MIKMPTVDIMTLITGEVEKPSAPVAEDGMADASFLSFFAGDETGIEQLSYGSDMVPDMQVGAEENNVDIPVAKVMLFSGMVDQQVSIMPSDGSLKQNDVLPILYVSPEKVTDANQPNLLAGPLKDRPDNTPDDLPEKSSAGAPVLQDIDVAQDVPHQTREAASILPQMVASGKQTNELISNDAAKHMRQPTTPVILQKGDGVLQQDVMPEVAARPRQQISVPTDPDVVSSPPPNTAMQKTLPGAPMGDEITAGEHFRQTPVELTEAKENHRGKPMPQASKGVEISNAIIPPKVQTIATPPNQQPAAVPLANAGLEPHVSQITPVSISAPLAPSKPKAELPVSISRTTTEVSTPHPANVAKDSAPDSAHLQKAQNHSAQHTPNRPASDIPNRIDPPLIQANSPAPLQTNRSTLPSVAHPLAPLQPTVSTSQSPKRQTSQGQLPQPDVQPAKQTTADAPSRTTIPPPPTDPAVAETSLSELTPDLIALESRAADSTTMARHDTITHRPEVGRHIAQQLAEVARQMPDRPVELTLNPDELGRVRLTFTMSDSGIHVAVIAERGETMDLMRRHIETLAQEFRDMGYKDVNFDFSRNGQGNSDNTDPNPDDPDTQTQTPTETQTLAPVQLSLEPSTGLDLRL